MRKRCLIFLLSLGLLTGCGTAVTKDDGTLQVVATTTMLADLVTVIGGAAVTVHGLMGSGVDPHLYQASAGDVTAMEQADVLVYNGLHLEGKMSDLFANLEGTDLAIVSMEQAISPEEIITVDGTYDPHIWFDVGLWQDCAIYVGAELSAVDPSNQDLYQANLEQYLEELIALETYVQTRVSALEEEAKILITAHDAFGYFGKAYGFTVIGLQGISTDAEVGTADVSALAEYIVENQVQAIFIESSVPVKSIQALQAAVEARGFTVEIGGTLYSDSLGDASSGTDTYLTTVRANVDAIVDGLKG